MLCEHEDEVRPLLRRVLWGIGGANQSVEVEDPHTFESSV